MESGRGPSGVRKAKKKQAKDEVDRIKQAEKKKRRLEKALATSAAIISELERKKEKKKEEQQRLYEEGAATAEAVALQVLIDEDPEESDAWGCCARNFDLFVGGTGTSTTSAILPHDCHQLSTSSDEETGLVFDAYGGSRCQWNGYGSYVGDIQAPYVDVGNWEAAEISAAGLIAAHAVSSLQIADDNDVNTFVFNGE